MAKVILLSLSEFEEIKKRCNKLFNELVRLWDEMHNSNPTEIRRKELQEERNRLEPEVKELEKILNDYIAAAQDDGK